MSGFLALADPRREEYEPNIYDRPVKWSTFAEDWSDNYSMWDTAIWALEDFAGILFEESIDVEGIDRMTSDELAEVRRMFENRHMRNFNADMTWFCGNTIIWAKKGTVKVGAMTRVIMDAVNYALLNSTFDLAAKILYTMMHRFPTADDITTWLRHNRNRGSAELFTDEYMIARLARIRHNKGFRAKKLTVMRGALDPDNPLSLLDKYTLHEILELAKPVF